MKNEDVIEVEVITMMDEVEITKNQVAVTKDNSKKLEVKREVLEWDKLMEMSNFLANSMIIPAMYQRRPENVLIAVDLASRMGVSPMMVMQNLFVIQGKPSWSGQAVASLIRSSEQFKNVELHYIGEEGTKEYGAYVTAERNGKVLKGTVVTIDMAQREGWYQKAGSKWQTMPTQMLGYRAYSFFGRLYAPEVMMGLHTVEEVEDYVQEVEVVENPYSKGGK